MSLYSKYAKERNGVDTIETEHAFLTYKIELDYIYIIDVYVLPEHRRSKIAEELMDSIYKLGKELGKKSILGSACLDSKNVEVSFKGAFHWGMRISHYQGNMIYFIKEIV